MESANDFNSASVESSITVGIPPGDNVSHVAGEASGSARVERGDVPASEILDVHVIADAGAVRRRPVGPPDREL